jgi:predicted transcriptional regulator
LNSIASTEFENEEEIVFNAVQDYLNENKIVEKNNLVNYIKSYFSKIAININEEGIVKNLESLIEKKRIVEGSKLTRNTVLQNEKRKKIYDCIVDNPGMYFSKILKNMNLSNHVVYWHVNILLKFNLIKTTEIQNRDIYFNSDFDERNTF